MKCNYCGTPDSKVLDSRVSSDGTEIKRRRECISCGKRFTTRETVETTPILVVKNSGERQAYDSEKVRRGIIKSCEKRPVPAQKIDKLVLDVTRQIQNSLEQEITSKKIGEMVMQGLREIDEVSYIRFASVYRQFKDTEEFVKELQEILRQKP